MKDPAYTSLWLIPIHTYRIIIAFYIKNLFDWLQNDVIILNAIGEDWKKTGRCDFAVAKEKFLRTLISAFAFPKNSAYTKYFTLQ